MNTLITTLRGVVGDAQVLTHDDPATDLTAWEQDWRKRATGRALAVVRPGSTAEVAAVVQACVAAGVSIVPQGGNTGLVVGSVPDDSGTQVVLSLTRMNTVRAIDGDNLTLTVDAGCVLQAVQEAAERAGYLFPLSLAAEGSCTIGGNLATNAGGTQVVRYGNARELCLGLEVVTAQGEVWHGLSGLRKDNTGYDLRDLFVGSEGTLGIITAATMKLYPLPAAQLTAWAAVSSLDAAVQLLGLAHRHLGAGLTGFEVMGQGKTCLLIVDDAQNLTEDSLELIRLLCNLETDQEKLLQILLAGQPELEDTLARHNLRQLRSRVVKHARLFGLHSTEIADYIRFRFESSGSDGSLLLATDACQILLQETAGVPRQIHLVMDRCLYGLAARHARVIDAALMKQAIEDSRVSLGSQVLAPPVRPAATATRSTPSPVAVALAMAVVVAAIGVAWYQSSVPVQAAEAPTARVAGTAPLAAALPVPPAQDQSPPSCALTDSSGLPAQTVHEQPLPELAFRLLGARLARQDGVCLTGHDGQHRLRWQATAANLDLKDRPTAARTQIALSHYGSLPATDVDGLWGERSRDALQRFQAGIGLAPTGEIDALSALILEKFYVQAQ